MNSIKVVIASNWRIALRRNEKNAVSTVGLKTSKKRHKLFNTPVNEFSANVRAPATDLRCQAKTVANEDNPSARTRMMRFMGSEMGMLKKLLQDNRPY